MFDLSFKNEFGTMKRGDLVEFHGFECEVVELYLNKVKIRRISDLKEKIVSRSVVKVKK